MYIPPNTESLKEEEMGPIRLGIQGAPGRGKTYSATTFPNPLWLDFDNALHDHYGKDIKRIPFWDADFIVNRMEWTSKEGQQRKGIPLGKSGIPDRREAIKIWLKEHGPKMTSEQTLVLDSWTTLQDAFDNITWHPTERTYSKRTGDVDDFAPWDLKISFSEEIMNLLLALRCNVVVTFHELQQRDKETGVLLDKIQPLMQGKFVAKLKLYFPFFFRAHAPDEKRKILPAQYVWQTASTNDFDAKCCNERMKNAILVPATYQSFKTI